ncbi:MAG: M48 family metallopeptidase [Ottowia sp.]|nr:M48 family metallopeptidase [Ottowia sp.]
MPQLKNLLNPSILPNTANDAPHTDHKLRHIHLADQVLAYRFKRSARRTIGLIIDEHGLSVVAPRWVPQAEIDNTLREKQKWIVAKLTAMQEKNARTIVPQITWQTGGRLPYLGGELIFLLDEKASETTLNIDATILHLNLSTQANPQQIKNHVHLWLQQQAKILFTQRLNHYAQQLGVHYTRLSLSRATTRWGSCGADGHIRLNWRLLHFPLTVIDYVVAHEVAHLKEMNHSPRFWQIVASIFPDYALARDHLKQPIPAL